MFENANLDANDKYAHVIMLLKAAEEQNEIQLIAGDCPIDEVFAHMEQEEHYTISHYFQCKFCSKYFFIGACIRGYPIYKILDALENERIESMLWGRCGLWFE